MNPLGNYVAYKGVHPRLSSLVRFLHGRAFSPKATKKVLVLYEKNRISYTQVYPLLFYARAFADRFGAQFRLIATDDAIKGFQRPHLEATHVLVQTWLTDPPERLEAVLRRLDDLTHVTRRVYLDSFANSDIRLARHLKSFDLYYKKAILKNTADLTRATAGHTTLTEYYGQLYGIEQESTDWQVPRDFLGRLRLAPNFLTGPGLLQAFLGAPPPPQDRRRDIGLHARFGGTKENDLYGAMRRDAEARVKALQGVTAVTGTGLSQSAYMAELKRSKVCFSPFGYGELCWRDIEAFMSGSVLLKPDMSHLSTEPDLYRDNETYVALRWDFADLKEKLSELLRDEARRNYIAQTAWAVASKYLREDGPVTTYADILA